MTRSHRLICGAALAGTLGLASCASDEGPQDFPPPDYGYLPQIHLNVATIAIRDDAVPTPDSLPARAPTPPDQALRLMASQRLIATGSSGRGEFIINQATLYRAGDDAVAGRLDVTLTVHDATNQHVGMAHAQVSRRIAGGDRDSTSRAVLYDITNQMMRDMNVELAYQVHKSLGWWLTDASGTPLTGDVTAHPLDGPDAALAPPVSGTSASGTITPEPTSPAATPAPKPAASEPDAIFPTGEADTPSMRLHSPAPGVLSIPRAAHPTDMPR